MSTVQEAPAVHVDEYQKEIDALDEWSTQELSAGDQEALQTLIDERKERAAEHVAELIERNKGLMDSGDAAKQARVAYGHQHK